MKKKYSILLLAFFCFCFYCSMAQTIVKMEQSGGIYKIPCKVNGLNLKFIFDTGASDISISLTEALFMLKNEYLSEKDFIGTEYYRIANGDIQEGTKVNIKCIEIGGQKIYNVQASITHTLDAPILFGQSALQRFGKFTIDYSTNSLLLGNAKNDITNVNYTSPKIDNADQKKCKDIDGNVYKTVKIGSQIWMAENLKTSHFRDGSVIMEIEDSSTWANIYSTGIWNSAWCYYAGNAVNDLTYGKLYNWYAVTDVHQLCPAGWHVPTDDDFKLLTNYLGGDNLAGGRMKATAFWTAPNTGADNLSGFTALPGGLRAANGAFDFLGSFADFWSSTQGSKGSAWSRTLGFNYSDIYRDGYVLGVGDYVRCIEDK